MQTSSLSRETLVALNPALPTAEPLAAGTLVVVHTGAIAMSESVGPPNDGSLIGGVPFPEGRSWLLPPDRSRAFGTGETIIAVLAALDEVVAIFLNRSQQVWLRAAAEADVGVAGADRYFAIIKHEPGHTIHFHVRFRCPDSDHRCVAYSLEETDAEVAKVLSKLPTGGAAVVSFRKQGKLPTLRPKTKPEPPSKKLPRAPAKGR